MATNVDTLQIEIGASSSDAAKKVRELSDSLADLKKTLDGNWKNPVKDINVGSVKGKPDKNAGLLNEFKKVAKIRLDSSDVDKASKKVGMLSKLLNGLKRVAFYRAIRGAIKAITDTVKEGTDNAYWYSRTMGGQIGYVAEAFDRLAGSGFKMSNQLGAAWATLKSAIAPVLIEIINLVTRAADAITRFFAIISGKGAYMRATDQTKRWADATSKGAAAAKEWKNQLMGFDEINRLEEPSGGGSGGGGSGVPDYADMYETVDVGSFSSKLSEVFDVFKKAWEVEGQETIRSIKFAFSEIKELAKSVGESFFTVFTNGTGQKSIELILRIVQNLSTAVGNLAENFRKSWDEAGRGTGIIQSVWNLFNKLLETVEKITGSIRAWAGTVNFAPLLDSVQKLVDAFSNLAGLLLDEIADAFENVVLPVLTWIAESAAPEVINTLAGAFDLLAAIIAKVEPVLTKLWDNILKPVANWTGDVLIEALKNISDLLSDIVDLINGKISFKDFIKNLTNTQTIVLGLAVAFGTIAAVLGTVFGVMSIVSGAASVLSGAFAFLTSPIGIVIAIITALIVIGVELYKNWDTIKANAIKTWNAILGFFQKIGEGIKEAFRGAFRFVLNMADGFVNGIVDKINAIISGIDAIARLFGGGVSFRIPHANFTGAAGFASGGFPEDGFFFANHSELVGQFSNGKTAVANNEQIVEGISVGVEDANEPLVAAVIAGFSQVIKAIESNGAGGGYDLSSLSRAISKNQVRTARAAGV